MTKPFGSYPFVDVVSVTRLSLPQYIGDPQSATLLPEHAIAGRPDKPIPPPSWA